MSKALSALAALAVIFGCVAGIQTYRLHALRGEGEKAVSVATIAQPAPLHVNADVKEASSSDEEAPAADEFDVDEELTDLAVDDELQAAPKKQHVKSTAAISPRKGEKPSKLARQILKALTASPKKNGDAPGSSARVTPEMAHKSLVMVRDAVKAAQTGDYETAIEGLTQSLELNPGNRKAYQNLASIYHKLGMSDEEMQTYSAWMAQRPTDSSPYYQQARLMMSLGNYSEAANYAMQFQQMTQGNIGSYADAASLFRSLRMTDQQGAVLQDWLSQAPNSVDAHRAYAQFLSQNGDRYGALDEYQTVAQLTPGNAGAHRDLATQYQRLHDYAGAQQELNLAMTLKPQDMSLRYQLGQVLQQSGDRAAATQVYSNIIATAPFSPEAAQAQRAIAALQRPPAASKPKLLVARQ